MKDKSQQQGIALLGLILVGALLITGMGIAFMAWKKQQAQRTADIEVKFPATPFPLPSVPQKETSQPPSLSQEQIAELEKLVESLKFSDKSPKLTHEDIYGDEPLLKILPPKEKAELESAIRETQQVLKNIEVFDYTPPSIDDITKGLDQINKETTEQIQKNMEKQQQEWQQKNPSIDPKKIEEYFRKNPPAVPQEGKDLPPEAKEYYYRKYILKDPAF